MRSLTENDNFVTMSDKNEENNSPAVKGEGVKQNYVMQLIETIKSLECMINSQCHLLNKVTSKKEEKDKRRLPSITGLERVSNIGLYRKVSTQCCM